ncbi:hypothetical protein KP509_31G072000 [Ceratopteris richardii]|uniref:Dynein light chain n=1 Tax=Ceratopteris richardii TaxID=49495 RepID=A0A8T2QYZ6_CERRI|nr:hypothetical protein KP509_31G072000 [Ceratopteris richardii]
MSVEAKAMIQETDMPVAMQRHAIRSAAHALDIHDFRNCQKIAQSMKQEFDRWYGGGWQCIVGTNFGSFLTHSHGAFIYFSIEKLAFLLFKGIPASCGYGLLVDMDFLWIWTCVSEMISAFGLSR